MKEVIEKIIRELENASHFTESTYDEDGYSNDDSEEVVNLCKAVDIVEKVLEEYVPNTNVGKISEWIPVEERLPEEDMEVLMTNWNNRVICGVYNKESKRFADMNHDFIIPIPTISAWMPLPEPY